MGFCGGWPEKKINLKSNRISLLNVKHFALPNVGLFNVMVSWGEFFVGIGLIIGCLTTAAVFFGLVMNFMYMFAGALSSNPWMVLLGGIILLTGSNAGKFGLDYVVVPKT
jgi:thiosulfate dehydrogenase [quinone] large subunit